MRWIETKYVRCNLLDLEVIEVEAVGMSEWVAIKLMNSFKLLLNHL